MRIFVVCVFLLFSLPLIAQYDWVIVDSIHISGNKKTKDFIILRELDFAPGDSIALRSLGPRLEWNRLQLMNTGLFSTANINIKRWKEPGNHVILHVELQEALYIYPVPIFDLADRNFNVWWEQHNHSFARTNYGIRFHHINLTGRRDYLKVVTQFGYTRKYAFFYTFPYLNRTKTLGAGVDFNLSQNHEVNYINIDDKQEFYKNEDKFILSRVSAQASLNYRPLFRRYHVLNLMYHQNQVDNHVVEELNPNYFQEGENLQRYFSLNYIYTFENRDIRPYPLEGNFFQLIAEKNGLGIFDDLNTLFLTLNYFHYLPLRKKWSLETNWKTRLSLLRNEQPFFNNRAFGFGGTFIRGYELYVVDGPDYFLTRNSLRYELFNRTFDWKNIMPIKSFRYMPVRIYLALNGDAGYVNNPFPDPGNALGNEFLFGGGLGLNLVVYYDKVLKVEYSFNKLGESGLFLHLDLGI